MNQSNDSDLQQWPPGTVLLEAKDGNNDCGVVVLQPQPSRDPNDPLNWSRVRKYWNFFLTCIYVLIVAELLCAATPTWGPMNRQLGFSYEILNDSYAAGSGMLGLGSILLIPLSFKFGRRPIYLLSLTIQVAVSVWSAKMQNVADLMLVNIISCFCGAIYEVIVQMTIADIFFVHERGLLNGIYVWTYNIGSSLGTLVAGYITTRFHWRGVWWANTIAFGTIWLLFLLGYEETKYQSPTPSRSIEFPSSNTHSSDDLSLKKPQSRVSVPKALDFEATETTAADLEMKKDKGKTNEAYIVTNPVKGTLEQLATVANPVQCDPSIPKKSFSSRLNVLTMSPGSLSSFLPHLYRPFHMLCTMPIIAYMALLYGVTAAISLIISTSHSNLLPEPPYNWSPDSIGLMSLPAFVGVTLGSLATGPFSDRLILWMGKRNHGIYEPEYRIWAMMPFVVFVPVGALLYGFGIARGLPWPVFAVGSAVCSFGLTPIQINIVTYVTDAYTEIVGDALVGIAFIRNCIGTSFVFALTPWMNAMGAEYMMLTAVMIFVICMVGGAGLLKYGRMLRSRSAKRYVRFCGHPA